MKKTFTRIVAFYLAVAMLVIGITPRVDAGFSPSELIVKPEASRDSDLERIRALLEMKVVGTPSCEDRVNITISMEIRSRTG